MFSSDKLSGVSQISCAPPTKVLIVAALWEVGFRDVSSGTLSVCVGFLYIGTLWFVVRCCHGLQDSLEKDVFHFLRSLWRPECRCSAR